ncbi:hypothetical protein [Salinicola aestuarinus]|uniref:hypothetical protein n=1 Tax=Salinicola aestuarinus TaxID=1949082 RepID=UPI000DA1BF89|nr:hypothetical protein [Salinicola aestuarinus]
MRKGIAAVTATTFMLLMGGAGFAQAQSSDGAGNMNESAGHSDAMNDALDSNTESMSTGSGVTGESTMSDAGNMGDNAGQSDATEESLEAVESETDEKTNIENSEELDELNADGQSDAAGEALQSQ